MAFGVGVAAGLRSLSPPAVVAWAAHLGWLNLSDSPLRFMASTIAVVIFSLLAVFELSLEIRTRLVAALHIKDIFVALLEDLVAIGLACFFVTR